MSIQPVPPYQTKPIEDLKDPYPVSPATDSYRTKTPDRKFPSAEDLPQHR